MEHVDPEVTRAIVFKCAVEAYTETVNVAPLPTLDLVYGGRYAEVVSRGEWVELRNFLDPDLSKRQFKRFARRLFEKLRRYWRGSITAVFLYRYTDDEEGEFYSFRDLGFDLLVRLSPRRPELPCEGVEKKIVYRERSR